MKTLFHVLKKIARILWIIVSIPWMILEEIAKACQTRRILLITDHPSWSWMTDRVETKTGCLVSSATDFETAVAYLEMIRNDCLKQATTLQMPTSPEMLSPTTVIPPPTELVVIDWGHASHNGNVPDVAKFILTLKRLGYSGCVLIRAIDDGRFKCYGDDSADCEHADWMSLALPLDRIPIPNTDDTMVVKGSNPVIL
ncbi:MAG: hypothetical protein WC227_04570 [Patescibacteria group bacterium]